MQLLEIIDGKTAMKPDGILRQMLNECRNEFLELIYNVVSCPINIGKVPLEWERVNIVPIYKSEGKTKPLNCRSVSLV